MQDSFHSHPGTVVGNPALLMKLWVTCATSWDKNAHVFTPKLDLARFFSSFQGFFVVGQHQDPNFPHRPQQTKIPH